MSADGGRMPEEQAKKLREPFPAETIGKLPRLICKACSSASGKACPEHPKKRCNECGAYVSPAHIHLDYVGHAAVTDRLLQVDPEWTWEPMALGPNGEPLMVNGGLWIRLTIAGVTRPGFGDGDSPKEIIGDAIRNAAMRFGVALDLWSKADLSAEASSPDEKSAQAKEEASEEDVAELRRLAGQASCSETEIGAIIDHHKTGEGGAGYVKASWVDDQIAKLRKHLEEAGRA